MEGIVILNETTIYTAPVGWFLAALCIVALGICVWLTITMARDGAGGLATLGAFLAALSIFLLCCSVGMAQTPPIKQYEVLVEDDVSFHEFFEKYEIVDTNGKIFVVNEK